MRRKVNLGPANSELRLFCGSSSELADELSAEYTNLVIVSDETVHSLLSPRLFEGATWVTVPAGESSKSVDALQSLWSKFLDAKLDRRGAVVAVGGGVVGDLAGFAASTYMRGVAFYSVPTSLLSMVDASVGGKVGIDLPQGKNLVGQFFPARRVAVDPELLGTLPESEWSSGMAEVIKHAVLKGEPLWGVLQEFEPEHRSQKSRLEELLRLAVEVKVDVVEEDPFEKTGLRATLNLGHTYGHAIEWCSGFRVGHGEAVGLGMLAGLRLSRALGLLEQDFESDLVGLLQRWNLPLSLSTRTSDYSWERMRGALSLDKKNKDGEWCFILASGLGRVNTVLGPPEDEVRAAFRTLLK